MKRSPSNRGANLSSAGAAAGVEAAARLHLLRPTSSSLDDNDPCTVDGHAADATAVAAAEAAAAAAPHLIARPRRRTPAPLGI
uniref:Uncharacterized protein n=1 Tax=Arundo donax TaxID=35708 RepID=A0A0A8ZDR0_ARUDO